MTNLGNFNLDRNSILILFGSVIIGGWLILSGEPPVVAQPAALPTNAGASVANTIADALPAFSLAPAQPTTEPAPVDLQANLAALTGAVGNQPIAAATVPGPSVEAQAILHGYDANGERIVGTPQGWFLCRQVDELGVKIGLPIDAQAKIMEGCANG